MLSCPDGVAAVQCCVRGCCAYGSFADGVRVRVRVKVTGEPCVACTAKCAGI